MRQVVSFLGLALAALIALLLSANTGAPASSVCRWSPVAYPGDQQDGLVGVAAASSSSVWAVGFHFTYPNSNPSFTTTLIEHWDGTRWSVVSSPNPTAKINGLIDVAALGRDAWAVGRSSKGALTLHWSGARWSQVPNPGGPGSALSGVAMVSSRDVWAIGSGGNGGPLVLHWNGSRWSKVADPGLGPEGGLIAVARIPGTSQVWVDGIDGNLNGIAARWTGSDWETFNLGPLDGGPGNLSAASTSSAWIVTGKPQRTNKIARTRIVHWDGTAWTDVPAPNPSATINSLSAVAARGDSDAWAVGAYKTGATSHSLAVHWNGSTWSRVKAPGTVLTEVTVVPGTQEAWAIGSTFEHYRC